VIALLALCFVTTAERVCFKMLVDRVVPYRFMVLLLIVTLEAIVLGVVVQCKACNGASSPVYAPFPRRKLLVMACLDLTKDCMLILSGAFVAPTLTVMLLQGQIPCSMLLGIAHSKAKHLTLFGGLGPGSSQNSSASSWLTAGGYRPLHFAGAGLIALSIVLAFVPVIAVWAQRYSAVGWNTLTYLLACVPASASVLYKEHALTAYRQPMDPYVLNLNVDMYQLLLLVVVAPLTFKLQTLGFFGVDAHDPTDKWTYIPAGSFSDGLACFFAPGLLDSRASSSAPLVVEHLRGDFESGGDVHPSPLVAYCGLALPLLGAYVGAAMLVNFAVDRVLKYGRSGPLLYRSVTAAFLSTYVVLGFLAHGEPTSFGGFSIAVLEIPSVALIVVGNELYHRFQEPGAEILTQWTTG